LQFHTPVLLNEVVKYLNIKPGKKYIDATIGGGGHAAAILERGGVVLGIDVDSMAVEFVKERLAAEFSIFNFQFSIVQGNFRNIDKIAHEHGFGQVAGILFDLGMSSWQIEKSGRGFSFLKDEPLDMRMDPDLRVTAADLVNGLTVKELYELFTKFGEEKFSRRIAERIVSKRRLTKIQTTKQLADLISKIYGGRGSARGGCGRTRIHPATRVFQALRIAVNDELNNLREALPKSVNLLEPEGRLIVISFHSLEDRIVKDEFKRMESESKRSAKGGLLRILTKKPVRATPEEIKKNPRARSARLRAAERR